MVNKEVIKKRVDELKIMRDQVTGSTARCKYNFAIGELEFLLVEE